MPDVDRKNKTSIHPSPDDFSNSVCVWAFKMTNYVKTAWEFLSVHFIQHCENYHFTPTHTRHQDGSFCRIFLPISPFQIINPENSLWRLKTVKSSLLHVRFLPSNYFSDAERECDFVLHFIPNWALIQSSSLLWIVEPENVSPFLENSSGYYQRARLLNHYL